MAVPFVHVQVRGSYRDIGRAVGEAARVQIEAAVEYYRTNFEAIAGMGFAEALRRAQEYLAHARRCLPQLVEELEGMAEASGVPFDDLLVPNCAEELTSPLHGGVPGGTASVDGAASAGGAHLCTAVALSVGGRRVVGHNMDWYAVDLDKNVLFDVTVPDGTRFLTIAGVPYLPMLGMNSHGMANVSNSMYSKGNRIGLPNVFVRRWSVEARSIVEAAERALHPDRACGSNHLLADAAGAIIDIETAASAWAELDTRTDGDAAWLAHTNHYIAAAMAPHEGSTHEESRRRLRRAEELLAAGAAAGRDPVEVVAEVLRDHAGAPDAICGHPPVGDSPPDTSITVGSMICDLASGRLLACAGPPCENPYRTFGL
jgi:isopenicillin-N N-acyltransferase-like protein